MFSQRLANGALDFENLVEWRLPLHLLKHHQFFPPRHVDGKCSSTVSSQQGMTGRDRGLDILRIVILAMQDDQSPSNDR